MLQSYHVAEMSDSTVGRLDMKSLWQPVQW